MKNDKNTSTPLTSDKKSIKNIIDEYAEQRRERRYAKDEAFHRSITPDRTPSNEDGNKGVVYRNGVDTRFLVYIILLLCFGAVMMYSATYVSAEQRFGDSMYFISRYIIFAIAAICATIPFVMYGRTWFWRGTTGSGQADLRSVRLPAQGKPV